MQQPTMRRALHRGWLVLATGTLGVFVALGFARFGYAAVLPAMQDGLGLSNTQAGLLATSNLIGYVLLAVVGGALASRLGPRLVITCGVAVTGLAMLLTGVAHGFADALLWRLLTGLGSGATNVPILGLMASWFAARRRGLAAGVAVAGSSLALIVIGPAAPRILHAWPAEGWRVCWFAFGGIALGVAALSWFVLRNSPAELGLTPVGHAGEDVASAAAVRHSAAGWRSVYGSARAWSLGLVYTAFGFSYIIYMIFFVKSLVADGGYRPETAGELFMLMGWFSLLCGVVWGSVSDVLGRRLALVLVYLLQALAFGLFAWVRHPAAVVVSAVVFGLTAWSIPAIMAAACGDAFGPRLAPAALGFVTLFFGAGQALGPVVAGRIADHALSFRPAFATACAVALLGAAMAHAFLRGAPTSSRSRPEGPPG